MARLALRQKLTLGLAVILVVVGGTMVIDGLAQTSEQASTFDTAQQAAEDAWAMPARRRIE